jgi:KDO2-lipid IV(A) lauroyltransferase
MEGTEPLAAAVASGRPLIILTGHYGNWELAAFMLTDFGIRAHLVARPLDNPYLDDLVRRFRESRGHTVVTKQGSASDLLTLLQNGGTICTLADQDAGEQGLFVDFFGRPASTHRAVANLALRTGALIVVVGLQNRGGVLDYAVRVTDVIDPRDYHGPVSASLLAITQRLTTGLETLVRFDPTQYLWLHRRWKTLPPGERPARAA